MIAGECYAMGREVPRPYTFAFLRCRECGAEVTHRRERATGRTVILEPGTDTEHRHAPAVPGRVELDVDSLAGAIVRASRAAREERRADRSDTPQPSNAVAPPASKPDPDGLQTVEVWPV